MLRRSAAITVILACITFIAFAPVCRHRFLEWDDSFNVVDNPLLNPVTPRNVLRFWQNPLEHHMYPLTYTMWAGIALTARRTDSGLNPSAFHIANLILHTLSTLVVFRILIMLTAAAGTHAAGHARVRRAEPGDPQSAILDPPSRAAALGALLFALHPVQVEPVAWITGGKDLLSGLLALLAIWQFLRAGVGQGNADSRRRTLRYALASAAFILAVLAKPTAAVVPLLAFVLSLAAPHKSSLSQEHSQGSSVLRIPRSAFRAPRFLLLTWLLLALPWVAMTKFTQRDEILQSLAPFAARPLLALDAVGFYIYKLVFPVWLGPDYGRSPEFVLQQHWLYATWLVPLGLLALILLAGTRRKQALAAAGGFCAGLLPVLGLVPFAHQAISTVADRYLYLPMLGPALALAWFLHRPRSGTRVVLCTGVLLLLGLRSNFQTRHWRDTISLFRHAQAVNPESALSKYNLGLAFAQKGELKTAIPYYRQAIAIEPSHGKAHNNLGNALARTGERENAIIHFSEALRLDPHFVKAHCNIANVLEKHGRAARALYHYSRALKIDPSFVDAHYSLALVYFRNGKLQQAVDHNRAALKITPRDKDVHNNLANLLLRQGHADQAIEHYSQAIAIDPNFANAHFNIALVLLQQKDTGKAAEHFRAALRIDPNMTEAREYLRRIELSSPGLKSSL